MRLADVEREEALFGQFGGLEECGLDVFGG